MCAVSMVTDHYREKWEPYTWPLQPYTIVVRNPITQDEVDEFRRLLERARKYDAENGEPDCELAEKRDALKKIADKLGVDISFV